MGLYTKAGAWEETILVILNAALRTACSTLSLGLNVKGRIRGQEVYVMKSLCLRSTKWVEISISILLAWQMGNKIYTSRVFFKRRYENMLK